jgi:virulence-associated protein VagC
VTERAKISHDSDGQAVRLPASCRFPAGVTEVVVRREGERIILEAVDEHTPEFLATLGSIDEEIPRPGGVDEPPRDPFK